MKAKMSKAPLVGEGKPQHAKAPVRKPPPPPHVAEAHGNGGKSTFTAPRKGDDMNPAACGYMRMKG